MMEVGMNRTDVYAYHSVILRWCLHLPDASALSYPLQLGAPLGVRRTQPRGYDVRTFNENVFLLRRFKESHGKMSAATLENHAAVTVAVAPFGAIERLSSESRRQRFERVH